MAYVFPGEGSLDYFPCHYGSARLTFRGPKRDRSMTYVAVLGGTETYGKFIPDPFPDLLERDLGLGVVNLGCLNAGPDVFLAEPAVRDIAEKAAVTVVQVMGAHNLSNRFYAVHPRRNDRFLGATPLLKSLFPQVDFMEFSFTRHMLAGLRAAAPDRFAVVAEELRLAWVVRMKALLAAIPGPRLLLWMADAPPPPPRQADLVHAPFLVDAEMLAALQGHVTAAVEVVFSDTARVQGVEGMSFGPLDAPVAALMPGPLAHREVARALLPVIEGLI